MARTTTGFNECLRQAFIHSSVLEQWFFRRRNETFLQSALSAGSYRLRHEYILRSKWIRLCASNYCLWLTYFLETARTPDTLFLGPLMSLLIFRIVLLSVTCSWTTKGTIYRWETLLPPTRFLKVRPVVDENLAMSSFTQHVRVVYDDVEITSVLIPLRICYLPGKLRWGPRARP